MSFPLPITPENVGIMVALDLIQGGGVVYDPDATALFARMTVQPDATRKQLISDRFVAGKAKSFWAKLDAIWVHAAHTSEAGRFNWLGNVYNCTPFNSPAFTTDRGFMGDGSSSYLSTGFNPATAVSPKFTQNSGCMGVRSNTDNAANGSLAGFFDTTLSVGTSINPRATGDAITGRLNSAASTNFGVSSSSIGMFAMSRVDSANISAYRQGSLVSSAASASTAPPSGAFRLGAITDASFRACQFSMGWISSGLTAQEHLDLFNWFEPYRTAVGVT